MSEKKAYQKPEINKVKLAPEEAVLGGCKTLGTIRTAGGKCDNLAGQCINQKQGS